MTCLHDRAFNAVRLAGRRTNGDLIGASAVKLKCACGAIYTKRTADIERGWGKSCSKRCAAIKRTSPRPNATFLDGAKVPWGEKARQRAFIITTLKSSNIQGRKRMNPEIEGLAKYFGLDLEKLIAECKEKNAKDFAQIREIGRALLAREAKKAVKKPQIQAVKAAAKKRKIRGREIYRGMTARELSGITGASDWTVRQAVAAGDFERIEASIKAGEWVRKERGGNLPTQSEKIEVDYLKSNQTWIREFIKTGGASVQ